MAIGCHGCGEPLHFRGQFCSHCGLRQGDGARAGRALRSRTWFWLIGFLAVLVPLALQLYWRQQAAVWMEEGRAVPALSLPQPPPELALRPDVRHETRRRRRVGRRTARRLVTERRPDEMDRREDRRPARLTSAPEPRPVPLPEETRLSLSVFPNGVTTYVYLNGGSLLGRAPLRGAPLRPGRHRLVLWAPAIRARAVCPVRVEAGEHASVTTALGSTASLERSRMAH